LFLDVFLFFFLVKRGKEVLFTVKRIKNVFQIEWGECMKNGKGKTYRNRIRIIISNPNGTVNFQHRIPNKWFGVSAALREDKFVAHIGGLAGNWNGNKYDDLTIPGPLDTPLQLTNKNFTEFFDEFREQHKIKPGGSFFDPRSDAEFSINAYHRCENQNGPP